MTSPFILRPTPKCPPSPHEARVTRCRSSRKTPPLTAPPLTPPPSPHEARVTLQVLQEDPTPNCLSSDPTPTAPAPSPHEARVTL